MKTAKQREQEFRRDLDELLTRHGAEIEITDDGGSYGMQLGIALITMDAVWEGHELVADFAEFQL